MKCKQCEEQGLTNNRIYIGSSTTTLLCKQIYHDNDGKIHDHNPNWCVTDMTCENGHEFVHKYLQKCPSCDYGKEE